MLRKSTLKNKYIKDPPKTSRKVNNLKSYNYLTDQEVSLWTNNFWGPTENFPTDVQI